MSWYAVEGAPEFGLVILAMVVVFLISAWVVFRGGDRG